MPSGLLDQAEEKDPSEPNRKFSLNYPEACDTGEKGVRCSQARPVLLTEDAMRSDSVDLEIRAD